MFIEVFKVLQKGWTCHTFSDFMKNRQSTGPFVTAAKIKTNFVIHPRTEYVCKIV